MDEGTLYRLERQAFHFAPYRISEECEALENDIKHKITEVFEQCQKKFHDMSRDDLTEIEELDNHIELVKNECMKNCKNAIAKIKNKMEEITYIPNDLDLFCDNEENENTDDTENEFQKLKQDLLEQNVFIAHLKQELVDYEEHEPLLAQTEQLIKSVQNQPNIEVPENIKHELVDITSSGVDAYNLLKHMKF